MHSPRAATAQALQRNVSEAHAAELRATGNSRWPLLMDASAGLRSETTKAEVLEEQFHVKKKCSFVLCYRKGHSRSWEQHEGKGRLSCNDDSAVLLGALLCGDSAALTT